MSDFRFIVTEHLAAAEIAPSAILLEPAARNTAPAICAAALAREARSPGALMLVAPSDHVIPETARFQDAVRSAVPAALDGALDDIFIDFAVLEHVNHPDRCFAEMSRTLKPGGMMIFTTPYYPHKPATERRAAYGDKGETYLLFPAEYHGNPISKDGALVTFHYGRDFPDLMQLWAPDCTVEMVTLTDPAIGVIGEFREVFIVTKRKG